jgi:hypothetical protein
MSSSQSLTTDTFHRASFSDGTCAGRTVEVLIRNIYFVPSEPIYPIPHHFRDHKTLAAHDVNYSIYVKSQVVNEILSPSSPLFYLVVYSLLMRLYASFNVIVKRKFELEKCVLTWPC